VAVLSMSKQEFSRLDVLMRVQSGRLRVTDACVLIGLQRRQVFRLLRGLKQDGATSLLSKRRGRPSNHRLPDEVRTLALSIVRERYSDFGPSLAAEKLAEHHGCSVSRETLRGWMIADGLWQDRRHRLPSPHQPRRRRDCLGELVQIDGSEHTWFEDRGPPCTLLGRLGRRFLQCRGALAHVFEMALARHRLHEQVGQCPDQGVDSIGWKPGTGTIEISGKPALLVFERWKGTDVVDAMLFVKRRNGFGPHDLAPTRVHFRIADVRVDHADGRLDHVAAIVRLRPGRANHKCVGACLRNYRNKGIVRALDGPGRRVLWEIVR
jgi:hypothetical protein